MNVIETNKESRRRIRLEFRQLVISVTYGCYFLYNLKELEVIILEHPVLRSTPFDSSSVCKIVPDTESRLFFSVTFPRGHIIFGSNNLRYMRIRRLRMQGPGYHL